LNGWVANASGSIPERPGNRGCFLSVRVFAGRVGFESLSTWSRRTVRRPANGAAAVSVDEKAAGQSVGVARGHHADTDPVAALDAWIGVRGTEPGPLFTSMRARHVSLDPLLGDGIALTLRNRARAAGLAAERITPHSLRAGHATEAAMNGVAIDRIAAQTRHRRLSTLLERHIRRAQALQLTTSRDLGL
jgi:integrase